MKNEIPEINVDNTKDEFIWYGINNNEEFAVSIQKKYELYQQICSSQNPEYNRYKNVISFAEIGAQRIAEQIRETYPEQLTIQRENVILTLLPKNRLESIGNIPYKMFGENMGICIAHDKKEIRRYLNKSQCKELNLNLKDNFNEFQQNLERKFFQSDTTWIEIIKGVIIVNKDNAASLPLIDKFWEMPFLPQNDVEIEILDQDTVSVKSIEENVPRMIYLPLIEYNQAYDGEVFVRKSGKIKPLNFSETNKSERKKGNKNWWEIWKKN